LHHGLHNAAATNSNSQGVGLCRLS
jgi:hypothetical protein